MATAYGQYATTQAVLKEYNNKLNLYKLVYRPGEDPAKDVEQLQGEYDQWAEEVLMLAEGKSKFTPGSTPQTAQDAIDVSQKLLSNPEYQPSDYVTACNELGMDPQRPTLQRMNLAYVFQPWQATGIHRMVQMYNDPSSKAVLLADASGLGKTHQILGFWLYVSVDEGFPQTLVLLRFIIYSLPSNGKNTVPNISDSEPNMKGLPSYHENGWQSTI